MLKVIYSIKAISIVIRFIDYLKVFYTIYFMLKMSIFLILNSYI